MNPWMTQLNDHRERAGLPRLKPDPDQPVRASASGLPEPTPRRPPRAEPWHRPGSVLKVAIRLVTGDEPSSGCGCSDRAGQMNAWGWWGCWKQRKTIAGWLAEEAQKRGHELDQAKALPLLLAAWREVRGRVGRHADQNRGRVVPDGEEL